MMKGPVLVVALLFTALPAVAQQAPDIDVQTYVVQLRTQRDEALSKAGNLAAEYPAVMKVYESRLTEALTWVKKSQDETAAAEAQKATLIEWLKQAQSKTGDTK